MSRRIVEHWFPPADYMDRLNTLYRAWDQASSDQGEGASPQLLTEGDPSEDLREQYEALRFEAQEAAKAERMFIRLQEVSRSEWRTLKEKHPPRTEGHEDDIKSDRIAGVNTDTVEDDLLYACVIEPVFSSRGDFDEWADDVLSQGAFNVLVRAAWELTNVSEYDPKSLPASLTQKSGATSE